MSLWRHFLLHDELEMRLFKLIIRQFKWQVALKSHFLPLDKPKILLWLCRGIDVSSGRQSLGTHFLPLNQPKFDLCKVQKRMFQGVACHFELIFGHMAKRKCDLGEVEKAMLQVFACHYQLIFGLWTSPKCDIDDTRKIDDSSCQMSLWSHFMLLDQPKMWLFLSR